MEKRNIEITLDTAKEWYQQGGNLREIALQAFSEDELKEKKEIKVWEDLLGHEISGYYLSNYSKIINYPTSILITGKEKNIFLSEKHARSALAMAQISQLLPYYNTNWENGIPDWNALYEKETIVSQYGTTSFHTRKSASHFLAFETRAIAIKFYENNKQLVKDYLMID